jgi:hypothetical protein
VRFYCHNLSNELELAASKYRQIAPHFDELTPAQRRRADHVITVSSIGATEDVRREKLRDITGRRTFCARVRRIEDEQRGEILIRADRLRERLNANLNGEMPAPSEVAKALDELAAIARDVDALPLVE